MEGTAPGKAGPEPKRGDWVNENGDAESPELDMPPDDCAVAAANPCAAADCAAAAAAARSERS